MSGIYAADGAINVTVVDGSAYTGLYAADGSWNVVINDGTSTYMGVMHGCGAFNVAISPGTRVGRYAPNGSLYGTTDSTEHSGAIYMFGLGAVITLSASTQAEGTSTNTTIGTFSVINGSGVYTFTETLDADNVFTISGSSLKNSAVFNFEAAPTHLITVQADNSVDTPITRVFTIHVTDVASPTITTASTASVAENATLSISLTSDQTVTWSIVGGADQGDFEISGTTLRWASNGTQNYEAPADADLDNVYVVTVRATNAATSDTTNKIISVTVTDVAIEDSFELREDGSFILREDGFRVTRETF